MVDGKGVDRPRVVPSREGFVGLQEFRILST